MKTIEMYEFVVNETGDMESTGFGPCIGVAFVAAGGGALMHSNDPRMVAGEEFLEAIESAVPIADRALISPVVFGGAPDEDVTISQETNASRQWICDKLVSLGFKAPKLHSCPTENSSQDVVVTPSDKRVTIYPLIDGRSVDPIVIEF
jgi:hypothetical protein